MKDKGHTKAIVLIYRSPGMNNFGHNSQNEKLT